MTKEQAIELLESRGQGHVMRGFDNLSEAQQETFLAQIDNINWSDFELIGNDAADARGEFAVPPAIELPEIASRKAEFEAAGIEAIKKGEVGAVLLAGGMGTRLGFDLPKGCYNVGETHDLYIFECLINNLLEVVKKADAFVPLYIMTSEKNDKATRDFFAEHDYFGYNPDYIKFFIQDMACAVDYDGKLLLEE